MCGICGVYSRNADNISDLSVVRTMCDTIRHRGPDSGGEWSDESAGIALGNRRLAVVDLSPTGEQPMLSSDGRFVIAYNGEVYNHRELRAELEERRHVFRGHSDTEVILEGCVEWGFEATLRKLLGMFAIALWDQREKTLLLARDRVGKKPLYYGYFNGVFLFGSELKALHAHPAFHGEVDREALTLFMRFGYIPAPFTIFRGVAKLRPGHLLVVRNARPSDAKPYWDALGVVESGIARPLALDGREATDELERLLRDATARRMIADVPLGAFLSGGVDSSTVVALMQAQSDRPVRTFSVGFDIEGYDEARYAKAVAKHLGTDHTELYVTADDTRAVIPSLPSLYDEPFADSSQIPTFLIAKLARNHVTVALSGDGGDELFGGYTRYLWASSIWRRARVLPRSARKVLSTVMRVVPPPIYDAAYTAVSPVIPARWRMSMPGDKAHKLASVIAADGPDALYGQLVSLWKEPEELVLGGREPATLLTDGALAARIPHFSERMMFLDLVTYLPDDILVKVDRASMGVSLEARAPLLDHRVIEWAWRLPFAYRLRDGVSKWLLRQVLYRYVPPTLIERPKMGFGLPIDVWLRGPLRSWAAELLDISRLRREGFLRPEPIRRTWEAHLSGRRNEQYRLWAVLMFQAWRERWAA